MICTSVDETVDGRKPKMLTENDTSWKFVGFLVFLKVLLIPSYRSTDFEVHRNWLAITHSLPVDKWYYEDTSEWTLDYPPFFAWFEHVLSYFAYLADPQMVKVENLNYASFVTIVFQKLTVIATDFVFIHAVMELIKSQFKSSGSQQRDTVAFLLIANFGLMIVDHIHFQYNGFLFGVLLLSLVRMMEGRCLESSLLFATLLNLKHIYLYIAPAYFVFLLKAYCFTRFNQDTGSTEWLSFSPRRFLSLGIIVILVFALSFGPFILLGQLPQVLSRLFPFRRGLCHAYWAPNFWALYNIADKAATVAALKTGLISQQNLTRASMTGGLVQEFHHTILPTITPAHTLVCTGLSLVPILIHLWRQPPTARTFLKSVILCAFGTFMFGWHVHEKAILMVIIPLCILAVDKKKDARSFLFLATVGHYSLFPLIFTTPEIPIKYAGLLCYTVVAFYWFKKKFGEEKYLLLPLLSSVESLYIIGLLVLECYCTIVHRMLGLQEALPFLPLMLTSVYCAVGVTYAWVRFYWNTLTESSSKRTLKTD